MSFLSRSSLAALIAAACLTIALPAMAQNTDAKPSDKPADKPAQATDEGQRRVDEFAEAARVVSGPAGNAECVWLGRNVVGLLWRNDMDTAFRHLDLYDRFGCPGPHIQSAFRCLVRQSANLDPKDPKNNQSLSSRVHSCWLNPVTTSATAGTSPAAGTTAAAQSTPQASPNSQAATAGGSPGATSTPGGNQPSPPKTSGTPSR